MKLSLRQFKNITLAKNNLAGVLKSIYIISGDEPYQLEKSAKLIRQLINKQNKMERFLFTATKDFAWQELQQALFSYSLFSDAGNLLDLKLSLSDLPEYGIKTLEAFCEIQPTKNVLIITTSKINKKNERAKWFQKLLKHSLWITVWPLSRQELKDYIYRELINQNYTIEEDALDIFINNVDYNLLAAMQELKKIQLAIPEPRKLSCNDIQFLLANNAKYELHHFIDFFLQGNTRQIIKVFYSLLENKTDISILLWIITKEVRLINHIIRMRALGKEFNVISLELQQLFKIPEFSIKKHKAEYLRLAHSHTENSMKGFIYGLLELDNKIKQNNSTLSLNNELLNLILSISCEKIRHKGP